MIAPRVAARKLVHEQGTSNPMAIAHRLGVTVDYVHLTNETDLGWIIQISSRYFIIVNIAAHDLWTSVRFTVAHELGHYVCHRHLEDRWLPAASEKDEPAWMRRQANEFASELLMPSPEARRIAWEAMHRGDDPARAIAEAFEVSLSAAAIRVRELGFAPVAR